NGGNPIAVNVAGLQLFGGSGGRLPDHEATFHQADDAVQNEGEDGQDDDAGVDGVDVERAFGLQDEVAYAAGGTQVFTDDGADECQADGGVQAGENPAGGRRDVDVTQELLAVGAQHTGVVEQGSA